MHFTRILSSVCCFMLWSGLAAADVTRVKLTTTAGDLILELDAERAPASVRNFTRYVNEGFYNGTIFHRVIEGFMIQGGGFTSDYQRKQTSSTVPNEANNGLRNERYTVAMARTNSPHSATSQFFINTVDNVNLDYTAPTPRGWGYAVFGRVVEGQDIVDQISQVPTGPGGPFGRDAPQNQIAITAASVLVDPPADPPANPAEGADIAEASDDDTSALTADVEKTLALESR